MAKKMKDMAEETRVMYIGPTVRALGLVQYRVYTGDVETLFTPLAAKYPLIMQLVVPLADIMSAKKQMETEGTPQHMAARQIMGGET
ncbi:hypothetical protein [Selenomonas sp. F0473]|uniref:hypothetical protein n=1 Tax=Selenomonas sp. F0473 TaxID=999423 RepID=UPI0025F4AA86|nr:hypothetical protein [Selenomonas sp. F0473]